MTKICNVQRDDWDHKILAVLWDYGKTCKKLMGKTLFILVYGQEVDMSLEYIVPSIRLDAIIEMTNVGIVEEILLQMV